MFHLKKQTTWESQTTGSGTAAEPWLLSISISIYFHKFYLYVLTNSLVGKSNLNTYIRLLFTK